MKVKTVMPHFSTRCVPFIGHMDTNCPNNNCSNRSNSSAEDDYFLWWLIINQKKMLTDRLTHTYPTYKVSKESFSLSLWIIWVSLEETNKETAMIANSWPSIIYMSHVTIFIFIYMNKTCPHHITTNHWAWVYWWDDTENFLFLYVTWRVFFHITIIIRKLLK